MTNIMIVIDCIKCNYITCIHIEFVVYFETLSESEYNL